jgi:hypothetical protein
LASDLFSISSRQHTLKSISGETDALLGSTDKVRKPLLDRLRALSQQGTEIAQSADNADTAALDQQKKQLDELTSQFKAISGTVIPLGKQVVLLKVYKSNLAEWNQVLGARYRSELLSLGIRLGVMLIILAAVLGVAELWRKTIFRYVRDGRRRYQLLLLRKIMLWIAIAINWVRWPHSPG